MNETIRTWERKGYTVEERDFDYDLHQFVIVIYGEDAHTIVPDDIANMNEIIHALDNGEDVDGWEDGQGNTVEIGESYIVESVEYANSDLAVKTVWDTNQFTTLDAAVKYAEREKDYLKAGHGVIVSQIKPGGYVHMVEYSKSE